MTEKELIQKLQLLKQIKPNQEWVFLVKNQILQKSPALQPVKAEFASTSSSIFKVIFGKQLAYSVVAFLFIMTAGFLGVMKGVFPGEPTTTTTVVEDDTPAVVAVRGSVEEFKDKSKTLSSLAKSQPEALPTAMKEIEDAAKELTVAVQNNPTLAKKIALEINNNKTYLVEVSPGLKAATNTLYGTLVEQLIKDFHGMTLTPAQQETVSKIKALHEGGDDLNALENALLFSVATEQDSKNNQ